MHRRDPFAWVMNATPKLTRALARTLGALAFGALLGASSLALAEAPSAYGQGPMVKVHPSDPPQADSGVGLSGARNAFVSFQVVLHGGDTGVTGVTPVFNVLSGPAGTIQGSDLRLFREAYLNTTTPSTPDAATGAWPDGLIPAVDSTVGEARNAFPMDVPANESRAIWADVHIPANAEPGTYQGEVRVQGQGLSQSVAVTLTVVDAALPSTATLTTAYRVSSQQVCLAHTGDPECNGDQEEQFALLGEYEQLALAHRITLSNIVPKVPADGNWDDVDRWVGPYLNGTAPNALAGAKMTSVQYMAPVDAQGFAAFSQHFASKGWLARAFDYTADEPPYGGSFADAAAREATVKQGAPSLRTLVTTTVDQADANGLSGNLDIIVPAVNAIDGTDAPYQGDQRAAYQSFLAQPGHALWLYQSCMSHGCVYGTNEAGTEADTWPSVMVDATAAQNRAMPWVDYLEGATGELYYETAQALPTAWTDQYQFAGNGDGTLFYPGTPSAIGGTTDVPLPSIRLALIRLGEQDYEWLQMVSDAGDPDFARQVARALIPTAHQVTADGTAFERAKLQLMARYLELTHKSPAKSALGAPPQSADPQPDQAVKTGSDPATDASTSEGSDSASGSGQGGCEGAGGCGVLSLLAGALGLGALRRRRR